MAETKAPSKTQYLTLTGKAYWAKVYQPDEFRGAVRWTMDFYPQDADEWAKFTKAGIQKKVKENADGKYFQAARSTTKLMKGRVVNFTPPVIYDKDGEALVKYVDENGKDIRSYDDADTKINRVGDPILIGNGSTVAVTLSVYPTAMGPGNRLESVRVIDLIEYERPETPAETTKAEETDADAPW